MLKPGFLLIAGCFFWNIFFLSGRGGLGPKGCVGRTHMIETLNHNSLGCHFCLSMPFSHFCDMFFFLNQDQGYILKQGVGLLITKMIKLFQVNTVPSSVCDYLYGRDVDKTGKFCAGGSVDACQVRKKNIIYKAMHIVFLFFKNQ